MNRLALTTALALCALPAGAQELRFPAEAGQTARRTLAEDSRFVATAPFRDGTLDGVTAEGRVVQSAWRVGDGALTTLQLLAPLRDQLIEAGYTPLFECETWDCGGFDFRYGIDVLPEPDMHVNLGDFRYFAAKTSDGEDYVSLVVSRSTHTGFVQLTRVGDGAGPVSFTTSTKTPRPEAPVLPAPSGPIATQLETQGHATLGDLAFPSGSSELGAGAYQSLAGLAAYLKANPDRRVMLVGHTDAEGALSVNVTLSRRRATAVMDRLVSDYGVSADQVEADGVGFLAPRASNLTQEGRDQNRRVEVILTSTQ